MPDEIHQNTATDTGSPDLKPSDAQREIQYEFTPSLCGILSQLGVSVLVSTYQAGKLAVVAARGEKLFLSFHNFERAMGVAARPDRLAVGAQRQIWILNSAPDIASRIPPVGQFDGCFLARTAHYTGEIQVHDLAFVGEELWCANTLFSCLCTLDKDHSFVPRWKPPFVSALAPEDRCHLNGFAAADGRPQYVTVLGETDAPQAWREKKAGGGAIYDIASGEAVLRGLSMPHSPRLHGGKLWVLDSGTGRMLLVDPAAGRAEPVVELPGYTRGLAFHGKYAFVGLSRIRETSVFGGLPIAERRAELKCGVGVVDLTTGRLAAHLEFKSGVEEIFAVESLGLRCPALSGPHPQADGSQTIWKVPPLRPGNVGPAARPRPTFAG